MSRKKELKKEYNKIKNHKQSVWLEEEVIECQKRMLWLEREIALEEKKELKKRINKAIEYIEGRFVGEEIQQGEDWNYFEHWYFEEIDKGEAEELLGILKGEIIGTKRTN